VFSVNQNRTHFLNRLRGRELSICSLNYSMFPPQCIDVAPLCGHHARMPGESTVRITVRLTPRAARAELGALRDGVLHVRVTAPPVDGAANAALLRLLAKRLRLARSSIRLVSGETARRKVIEVDGLTAEDLWARLGVDVAGPAGD
jgi:uncharacterized protein